MTRELIKGMIPEYLVRRRLPASAGNSVLLTFDDGPTPGVTEYALDLLDQYQARAIFFVVGINIPKAPSLLAEILRRGHVVGNHTFDHDSRFMQNPAQWWNGLRRCNDLIEQHSGQRCRFFRSPESRLSHLTVFGPRLAGLEHILWSLNSQDWACPDEASARQIAVKVDQLAQARDIVVCHDFSRNVHTLLADLLPRLRDRGFDLSGGLTSLAGPAPGGEYHDSGSEKRTLAG